MIDSPWKTQAQLWCCQTCSGYSGLAGANLLAVGTLEDMVRQASAVEPDRQGLLLLGRDGGREMIAWDAIQQLRATSTFPIEI